MGTSDEGSSASAFAILQGRLRTASAAQVAQAFTLFALTAFIFWNRVRNYNDLIRADGRVTFPSVDAWYHRRTTHYTVDNFPNTIPFDPFTAFPTGNHAGQFGTVFDQLLAAVALVIGGGNPSPATIDAVLLFAPPVLGVLTVIPIYLLAKEVGTEWGGLVAIIVVALSPGLFLSRTVAGFADHHIAETLLVAAALCCYTKALSTRRDADSSPTPIRDRLRSYPRSALRWSALAGVTTGLYLLTWPPGVFFIAALAVFFHIQIVIDYLQDRDPRSTAVLAIVGMGTTSAIIAPFLTTTSMAATDVSILQAGLPALVGVSAIVISEVASRWGDTASEKVAFLLALGVVGTLSAVIFWVVAPEKVAFFVGKSEYVIWFVGEQTGSGIAETTSPQKPLEFGLAAYGFALLTAILGWMWMLAHVLRGQDNTGVYALLVVFSATIASATVSQVRFDYYLIIAVAILSGWAVHQIHHALKSRWEANDVGDASLRAKLVISVVLVFIVAPLAVSGTPVAVANNHTSVADTSGWQQTFDWVESGTPAPGSYGTGEPPRLDYTGAYSNVDDFQYQDGEYGIMTRWDVGHRLTVETHRIPVSNPHQQHASGVADVLLEDDESVAIKRADEAFGEASGVPYVILDNAWGGGNSGFANPAYFERSHNLEAEDLHRQLVDPATGEELTYIQSARSYQSLRTRLYQFHGSAAPASNLVVYYNESNDEEAITAPRDAPVVREFESPEAAEEAAADTPNAVQGGLYGEPSDRVEALERFRLVYAAERTTDAIPASFRERSPAVDGKQVSEVKVFERVEGASITGTTTPNATVEATVNLSITTTGKQFSYTQSTTASEDGTFELTVPYATAGYGEYTTENGYTNTTVEALGPYEVTATHQTTGRVTERDEVAISEGAILGESDGRIVVFE